MSEPFPDAVPRSPIRQLLLVLGAGITLMMVLLLIPIPFKHRVVGAIGDLVHAPLFGGATLVTLVLLERFFPIHGWRWSVLGRVVAAASMFFSIGLGAEYAQKLSGRSPAWHDAVANGVGILAAVFVFLAWRVGKVEQRPWLDVTIRLRRWLILLALFCLAIAWWQPLRTVNDVIQSYRRFPLITSFESDVQLDGWYFRHAQRTLIRQPVSHGKWAMQVTLVPKQDASFLCYDFPGNWTEVASYSFDVQLSKDYPEPTASLQILILDSAHRDWSTDLFQTTVELTPGKMQTFEFSRAAIESGPPGRHLDLSRISHLGFSIQSDVPETTLVIDHLRVKLQSEKD